MQTSNIILTITLIVSILLCFRDVYKNNRPIDPANQIIGNGVMLEKEFQHSELNTILLNQDYDYYLDPHSNKTIIKTDENILPHIYFPTTKGLIDFRKLQSFEIADPKHIITPGGQVHLKPSEPIKITIGINGINELSISCENYRINSYQTIKQNLKTTDTIHLDRLTLQSGRYHNIDLMVDVGSLIIDNRPFSSIKISGNTDQMELKSEISGIVDASTLNACNTMLNIHQSTDIQINSSCVLSGIAENQSKIINHSKASQNKLVLISSEYTEI